MTDKNKNKIEGIKRQRIGKSQIGELVASSDGKEVTIPDPKSFVYQKFEAQGLSSLGSDKTETKDKTNLTQQEIDDVSKKAPIVAEHYFGIKNVGNVA